MHDVIVVGGGPAGLSAALILGRCRRNVLLCDDGRPRNRTTKAVHGFLTRDGIEPLQLRQLAREQLSAYPNVEVRSVKAVDAGRRDDDGFEVTLETGETLTSRALLLATGVIDELPDIPGFDVFYGTSIHHCPYCDGWEQRDRAIGVYGQSATVCPLALELRLWSRDIAVFTHGFALPVEDIKEMDRWHIPVYTDKIERIEGRGGELERIVLTSGAAVPRNALFFSTGQIKRERLAQKLGCEITDKGAIATDKTGESRVQRVFCAGDNTEAPQLVAIAVAEGAKAALAINKSLLVEDIAAGPDV